MTDSATNPVPAPPTGWARIARRIRVPLGFLFAIFYFYVAHPTWASIAAGLALAAPGVLIRALASGHIHKNEQLTTSGPYAYTRNPLYLGSFIIALGFAVASRSLWIAAVTIGAPGAREVVPMHRFRVRRVTGQAPGALLVDVGLRLLAQ